MLTHKRIKVGGKYIDAIATTLGSRNLVVLKGARGYVMCGYLNLAAAIKFKEVAVKVTGVSTIEEAINARVSSCTPAASRLGIHKGQAIKEVIRIIA